MKVVIPKNMHTNSFRNIVTRLLIRFHMIVIINCVLIILKLAFSYLPPFCLIQQFEMSSIFSPKPAPFGWVWARISGYQHYSFSVNTFKCKSDFLPKRNSLFNPNPFYNNIQLSSEGEVNSGGYIPRHKASRYLSTALHRP